MQERDGYEDIEGRLQEIVYLFFDHLFLFRFFSL